MAELKTQPSDASVDAFLDGLGARRRDEARRLIPLFEAATGAPPVLWGGKIVGFGQVRYRYASGREGDWFRVGFAPQARHLALHLLGGTPDAHADLLARLGPHRAGAGCVYVTRLDRVDEDVLAELLAASVARVRAAYD